MTKLVIRGGNPLKGEVTLAGAKNSGFKLMIASLLSKEKSTIHNFSKIGDVLSTTEIINDLGGKVALGDNHVLDVYGAFLDNYELSEKHGRLSRASTYFVGPLLAKFGRAVIPIPGGCKIGRRPLDRHLDGFRALGATIKDQGDHYLIEATRLKGTSFKFPKVTHGGTDVMLIAAAMADGETVLENVALEPEVDDLINFLNKMGAKIKRLPDRKIIIQGVNELHGVEFTVMPDRNEAVTFACAALITQGDVLVKKADPQALEAFLSKVNEIGGGYEAQENGIRFFYKGKLKSSEILTEAHPGFMTDWQSIWTVLMTQAEGQSTVHETIFENRFGFVPYLLEMGAKIELYNPKVDNPKDFYSFNWEDNQLNYFHAARIFGSTPLRPEKLTISDIRAGATLILAALIARGIGETELIGVEHLDRGYENLEGRLQSLGADIRRVEGEGHPASSSVASSSV